MRDPSEREKPVITSVALGLVPVELVIASAGVMAVSNVVSYLGHFHFTPRTQGLPCRSLSSFSYHIVFLPYRGNVPALLRHGPLGILNPKSGERKHRRCRI